MTGPGTTWGGTLEQARADFSRVCARAGLGSVALGLPDWDSRLWRMGREHLLAQGATPAGTPPASVSTGADVYLASQIYANGGHTALIGDFVRSLDPSDGACSFLILTNLEGRNTGPVPEVMRSRVCLPRENITVLDGPSLNDRLLQLFALLHNLRPGRLFLFHHPGDPLASVVAQPEIAGQCVLVHHADSSPSFGLHVPGVRIIDLNPVAAAMTRLWGLDPALLLLTAPDPGPRPHGFLRRGRLVTASSGSAHKFSGRHAYDYPGTVGVILRSTGGWHVHIGPLAPDMLGRIKAVLDREHLPADRFIHVPWVASVATALWAHECDVYFSSFPVDGARTNAEVMASATPHLRHSTRPGAELVRSELSLDGGLVWRSWEDLSCTLQDLNDRAVLEEKSGRLRRSYERLHHPRVFTEQLRDILSGGPGFEDPCRHEREHRVVSMLIRALVAGA